MTWGLQAMGVSIAPLPTALLALPFGIAAAVGLALLPTAGYIASTGGSGVRAVVFVMARSASCSSTTRWYAS